MTLWILVALIVLAIIAGVFLYVRRAQRGTIESADIRAATVLVGLALLLVILAELIAPEIIGVVFFLWLPAWLLLRKRRA